MESVINRSTFISSSGISQLDSLNGQEENQSTAFTEQRELLSEDVLETAFTVIAGSAFTFNLMFCLVLLKKREMLRKPHNTLLFNLAITDFLTGVLLVVTPGYVSKQPLFPVPSGPGGHVFCSLLANRYLLFTVAKVSILLVTCLAVERWYCVMRPVEYKTQFDRKHLLIYILLSWVTTCALQSHKFMQMKSGDYECVAVDVPYGREGAQAFIAIYSFIVFVSPCIVTWLTFAHIRCHAIGVARPSGENARREKQQKLVLRMCAITAVVITICWFPAQLSYSLTPFGITRVSGAFHKACNVIAFFNSCMNPFIYWYYHREYRQELVKLFHACKFLCYKDGTVINRHVSLHVSGQGIPQRQHQGHFCRVTMDELLNFSLPQNHQVTQSTSDDARVD